MNVLFLNDCRGPSGTFVFARIGSHIGVLGGGIRANASLGGGTYFKQIRTAAKSLQKVSSKVLYVAQEEIEGQPTCQGCQQEPL